MSGTGQILGIHGMTPGGVGIWTLIFIVIAALVKVWPIIDRQKRASDDSLRTDLLARIASLEAAAVEERRHCDERLASMQAQIDALHRIIVQHQISTGRAIELPTNAPAAMEALERMDRLHHPNT